MSRPTAEAMRPSVEDAEPGSAALAEEPDTWRVSPRTVAIIATLLAATLAAFHLGHKSFWLDEGYSLGHARLPWHQFWHVLATREQNGFLHSLLLFGWIRVSDAEWWMRLPSAICAVAAVPLVYLLLKRLFDERTGAVAALVLAANAFWLQFAQEARPYALLLLMSTASALLLVTYLQERRPGAWWGWITVSALLPFTHLFGWLVLGVEAVAVLFLRRGLRTPVRRLLVGFTVIALAGGQIMLLMATGSKEGQAEGIPGVTFVRFVGVYARIVGNGGVLLLALVGGLWLYATSRLWSRVRDGRFGEREWGTLLLIVWLALPTVAIALLSPIQPLFGSRYFIILLPAAAGLTAVAVMAVAPGRPRKVVGAALAILLVIAVVGWYRRPPADDLRDAAATVGAAARPGDVAVFLPWFVELPFDPYALDDDAIRNDVQSAWPTVDWGHFVADYQDHPSPDEVEATAAAHDRVWLVVRQDHDPSDDADLSGYETALRRDHRLVLHEEMPGLDVYLFERP